MKNQNDEDLVMPNLNKLKQASEKLRKVSVTDDYTVKEREEIKKKWKKLKVNQNSKVTVNTSLRWEARQKTALL